MFTWKSLLDTATITLNDFLKNRKPAFHNSKHIKEAIRWLCKAQDSTNDGGVSEGYHLYHGWLPSYPETTGYIIETFFDYYNLTGDESIKKRAVRMADWLISIQNDDGSISDSYFKKKMVFDTGQVIFGLARLYEETKKARYMKAAVRAGEWLIEVQEEDGTWQQYALGGIPHTYYTRVAWCLARLHRITNHEKYLNACTKNINWAVSQQEQNGWFNNAAFNVKKKHSQPFTHTIAYTIRGILEAGIYLNEDNFVNCAAKAADNLIVNMPKDGMLFGTYDKLWNGNKKFSCLTGNAQTSIIFFILYGIKRNDKYLEAGKLINRFLKDRQVLRNINDKIYGAIAGSYPIWGKYIHFTYPNWAVKFFVDALLLEEKVDQER